MIRFILKIDNFLGNLKAFDFIGLFILRVYLFFVFWNAGVRKIAWEDGIPNVDRFSEFLVKNLITIDSLLGQNSIVQAKEFNNHVPLDGAILTKLDGTAKGGIIFPLYKELGIPVQYIGVGEDISDFELFNPNDYLDGLLGEVIT